MEDEVIAALSIILLCAHRALLEELRREDPNSYKNGALDSEQHAIK
jgi:hypothetical protein